MTSLEVPDRPRLCEVCGLRGPTARLPIHDWVCGRCAGYIRAGRDPLNPGYVRPVAPERPTVAAARLAVQPLPPERSKAPPVPPRRPPMTDAELIAAARPGMSAPAIAAALDRPRTAVILRLRALRAEGLIPPYERPMRPPPDPLILQSDPAPSRKRLSVALPPGSDPVRMCKVEGCDRPRYSVMLCKMHYLRSYRSGHQGATYTRQPSPDAESVIVDTSRSRCMVVGCRCARKLRGVCRPHYDYLHGEGRLGELPPGRGKR